MVGTHAKFSERSKAHQRFDKLNEALSSGHGILTEMIDPASSAFLDNLLQGLSHLAHVMVLSFLDKAAACNSL